MKYIPLQGQPCKLHMKYIPLQGQPCKLYEIHTLTGNNPVNYMKYIPLRGTTL